MCCCLLQASGDQLIVDVVATTVAAGKSVLVASTDNGAVDEVWRRYDELVPGSVVRTGSRRPMKNPGFST